MITQHFLMWDTCEYFIALQLFFAPILYILHVHASFLSISSHPACTDTYIGMHVFQWCLCAWNHQVQWSLSNGHHLDPAGSVWLYREVSLIQSRFVYSSVRFELQTVSSLDWCPLFRVSFIERIWGWMVGHWCLLHQMSDLNIEYHNAVTYLFLSVT